MIAANAILGVQLIVGLAVSRAFAQKTFPGYCPTTIPANSLTNSLTDLLTGTLTIPTPNPTPNSTPNRTICVRSSRARRKSPQINDLRRKCFFGRAEKLGFALNFVSLGAPGTCAAGPLAAKRRMRNEQTMAELPYALSLKQPWATLLVHGLKCIEVRSWPTFQSGEILIHAARISDTRPQGWKLLPGDLLKQARLVGGLIGRAELTGCIAYRTAKSFAADRRLHLNDPSWYRPPRLFGFVFARSAPLPFRRCAGNVRFFRVAREGTA